MDTYSHGHSAAVLAAHRWRTAANSAAYLLPHVSLDSAVLDVGCGPGTITLDLAEIARNGRVVGIDNVDAPLAEARASAEDRGLDMTFARGDVYALDFPDASFDVVHAHQVLQHLRDPVAALREMRRVCRPGGVVAARDADYEAFTWHPASPALDAWLATYRGMARGNGAEPDAGRRLLSWAHAAGLDDVSASASVWCFATPDDRAYWAGTWSKRVTTSAYAEQAVDRGLATPEGLDEMSEAFGQWAQDDDGWFTVLHGEILCRR